MTDVLIITGFWLSAVFLLSQAIQAYERRRITPFYALACAIIFLVIGISAPDVATGYAGFGMFIFSCVLATLTQTQGVVLQYSESEEAKT
jgi:uncharacterized MnhB-related membrane protein